MVVLDTKESQMKKLSNYKIEVVGEHNGENIYTLTGKRGAVYGTVRYANDPSKLWVLNVQGSCQAVKDFPTLTDINGRLEVA